jgi:two-component system nitrate/nitrite sensor histidine kinase NarX
LNTPGPVLFSFFTDLLRQITFSPETSLSSITVDDWPEASPERNLLSNRTKTMAKSIHTDPDANHAVLSGATAEQLPEKPEIIRASEQTTLLEISGVLASTLELQPDLMLDQFHLIVPYTHATLFAVENLDLVPIAVRPRNLERIGIPVRLHQNGPETLDALFNPHEAIRIPNGQENGPRAVVLLSLLNKQGEMILGGAQSWMWVPMAAKGQLIGGVVFGHSTPDFFTSHHAELGLIVANQAAISMINAELYGQAQNLAALQERQLLAQDLHDAINQSLFSAALIAEVLPRLWVSDPNAGMKSLEDLRRLTRGAMAEMRAMLVELRFSTLTDSDLGELLQLLSYAFTGRTDVHVNLKVIENDVAQKKYKIPSDTQVAFYRVCQEALNNIAKHARAGSVQINLKYLPDGIEMHIRDDGRGFDPSLTHRPLWSCNDERAG